MTQERLALAIILCSYLTLTFVFSEVLPFNKGTDEGYNLTYTQFILTHGRLPITYAERQQVGAKANWPAFYHLSIAALTSSVDPTAPPTIKLFWDSFRYRALDVATKTPWYLLSEDQYHPYQGLIWVLHVGRWVAMICGALTLAVIYWTLRQLNLSQTGLWGLTWLAFLPSFVFITASMNEDGLIALCVALYFGWLIRLIQFPESRQWHYGALGLLLGLSMTVKYTTVLLPFEVAAVIFFLTRRYGKPWGWAASRLALTGLGTLLGLSWWLGWNIGYLNRVAELGWGAGLLAPFSSGANVSMARLGGYLSQGQVGAAALPEDLAVGTWGEWVSQTYLSFWGIEINQAVPYAVFAYSLVALVCLSVLLGVWRFWQQAPTQRLWVGLALGHVGLTFILPLLNFAISRRIGATAQGRHLFIPAATAFVLLAVWGLTTLIPPRWQQSVFGGLTLGLLFWSVAHGQALALTPAPLPFRTTPMSLTHAAGLNFADKVALQSYDWQLQDSTLQLQLAWQPLITMTENYPFTVALLDQDDNPVTLWQGHHGQGRVPTLAWEQDMTIFDRLTLPLLRPGPPPYRLQVSTLTQTHTLTTLQELPSSFVEVTPFKVWPPRTQFRYPETILILTEPPYQVALIDEAGQAWPPTLEANGLHNFIIGPRWPSGSYRLQLTSAEETTTSDPLLTITNWWPRHFAPPEPIAVSLQANFANQVNLLGYKLPRAQVTAGDAFPITLYWQAQPHQSPQANFIQFNNLLNDSGQLLGGYQRLPLEYYSTLLWAPGEVVVDGYTVPVSADAPPGQYYLDVGYYLIVGESAVNLPLVVNGARSDQSHVTIGPIEVVAP